MSSPEPLPSDHKPTPMSPPVVVVVPATPPSESAPVNLVPVLPPPMQVSLPTPTVPTLPPPLPIPVPSLPPPVMPPEINPASPPPALPLPVPSQDPAFVPVPPTGLTTPPPPSSSSSPSTTPPAPSSSNHPPARTLPQPQPPPSHSTHHRAPPSMSNSNSTMSDASSALSRNLPLTIGITAVAVALIMVLGFGLMSWICSRKKKKQPPRPLYRADHPPPPHAVGVGDLSYRGGSTNPANRLQPVPRLSPKGMERVPSAMASPGTPMAQPAGLWTPMTPQIPSNKNNMSLSGSFMNRGFSNHISFTYDDLADATGGFSNATVIGHGGFGFVYKGVLPSGREVAIKCLKLGAKQGDREFQAEVETISRVHHRHLVSLVGYCIEGGQRILVYDFVPNKSLDYHLHGKERPCMEWSVRLRIALGAAKGLAYLHEDCHPRIIHRDIKASNTLLDMNFDAKVADFGLAKLTTDTYTHVSTRIMGTFGYLAPEYASTGKLTEKSDVFSFGVLLLELITGRRPYDAADKFLEDSLIDWARPEIEKALEERNFTRLVDPRLEGNYVPLEMACMVACAGACIRHSAKLRPKMSQVVRALERESALEELNYWRKQTEAQQSSSNDYESSSFEKMRTTAPPATKPALKSSSSNDHHHCHNSNDENKEFVSSEYGGATTSEYGLDPSSSSSSSSDNESDEVTSQKATHPRGQKAVRKPKVGEPPTTPSRNAEVGRHLR